MLKRACLMLAVIAMPSLLLAEVQPAGDEAATSGPPASQPNGGPPPEHPMFRNSYSVSAGVAHQFTSDTDPQVDPGDTGDFSVTRYGLGLSIHYPVGNDHKWLMDHSLVAEHDDYNFGGTLSFSRDFGASRRTILTQEPWEATELVNYSFRATYLYDRDWSFFGGPTVGATFEQGADVGDALSYGLVFGVRHQVNKDLAIGFGGVAIRGISEEYSFLPMLLIEWQISDHLAVRNSRPNAGLRGTAGAELAWTAGKFEICGGATYERREFRLDDEGFAADGIGRNTSIPVYARLNYIPSDRLSFSVLAGYLFAGELRIENDDGSRIGTTDYESAPFVSLGAAYRF